MLPQSSKWISVLGLVCLVGGSVSCGQIRVAALPTPQQPMAESMEAPRIPPPSAQAAQTPTGYVVELVMSDLEYPTSVEFDAQGNMYVAEAGYVYGDPYAPARIWRVSPQGQLAVVADQLAGPITDLLWYQGRLYISQKGKISILEPDGQIRDLVTGLPSHGDHSNGQMSAGPDGRIYFGQGTMTNSGVVGVDNFAFGWLPRHPDMHDVPAQAIQLRDREFTTLNPMVLADGDEPMLVRTGAFQRFGAGAEQQTITGTTKASGTILRMNPDGTDLKVFAWGLRNPMGVMWGPDHQLYATDNGFDQRGSRPIANAPDAIWQVQQGAWYGWPDFAAGMPVTDERFRPTDGPQPQFLMAEHPQVEQPLMVRPPHAAACKIDFSTNPQFGFPNQMFVAEFGEATPVTGEEGPPVGYQVLTIDPARGQAAIFFRARQSSLGPPPYEYVATPGPKRPIDVRFSPDGLSLYVVDIGGMVALPTAVPMMQNFPGSGAIWRIRREGAPMTGPPANLSPLPRGVAPSTPVAVRSE